MLDSLYEKISKMKYEEGKAEYNKMKALAKSKKDEHLNLAIEFYQLQLKNELDKANSSIIQSLNNLILKATDGQYQYIKTDAQELLANYYWKTNNYPFALENYLYAYQQYSKYSYEKFRIK